MIIIEALMLTILVMTLAFCSYTDCRESIIRNRTLVKAATAVTVLDTIYYVAYGSQYLPTFLMNAGLLAVVAVIAILCAAAVVILARKKRQTNQPAEVALEESEGGAEK